MFVLPFLEEIFGAGAVIDAPLAAAAAAPAATPAQIAEAIAAAELVKDEYDKWPETAETVKTDPAVDDLPTVSHDDSTTDTTTTTPHGHGGNVLPVPSTWNGLLSGPGSQKGNPSSTDGDGPGKNKNKGKRKKQLVLQPKRAPTGPKRKGRNRASKGTVAPVAISVDTHTTRPTFALNKGGDVLTVSRLEFVDDIVVPDTHDGAFYVKSFVATPINSTLFRWLSGLAARYEAYSFTHLALHYRSTSPTTTSGMVGLAAEYDAKDETPIDKHQFLNIVPSKRSSVWASCDMNTSRSGLNLVGPHRYSGDLTTNEILLSQLDDQSHTRFAGKLYAMFDGCPANTSGELWVSYTVSLKVPDYSPVELLPEPFLRRLIAPRNQILDPVVVTDKVQDMIGVSLSNDLVPTSTMIGELKFTRPSSYYRVTITIRPTASNAYIFDTGDPIWELSGGGISLSTLSTNPFTSPILLDDVPTNATVGNVVAYFSTGHISLGGPTATNPGYARINMVPSIKPSQTSIVGITVQEVTKKQWDFDYYLRDPERKHKSPANLTATAAEIPPGRSAVQSPRSQFSEPEWVRMDPMRALARSEGKHY
jgi:hypothetical protein